MTNEAKAEETVAEIQVTEAAEAPAAKTEEVAAEEEDPDVEDGYLQKRGTNPINPWNKRFFAFGAEEPLDIANLQKFHRRNERRVKAVTPAPAKEEKKDKDKAPEAEAEATSSDAAKAPAADEAKDAPKTVQDVYEEANKDLLVNIAHATQTGKGLLFYHRSSNSMDRKTPLGIINLRDVNSVEKVEKSSKNRSFVVSTKNRDYHFSAESPQKANGWVKSIKDKADEAKDVKGPYDSPQFNDIYQQLVARQAFEHAKSSVNIVADNEINSDGEPDDIEVEDGKAIIKKRNKKTFLGFSAVETSHEIKKEGGITTEVSSEQKKDLTHVQDENVDALKTHESQNAVSHTTDAPATSNASASSSQEPKSPKSGGFKLFGKKSPKTEEPPAPPAEHKPLTVDEAKSQALKAVDDAVEASQAKAAEAKVAANSPPPPPPVPEKKPSFFAGLFQKKPAPPPPPPAVPNEETIVISTEKSVSDVVTAEGEATSQSNAGFFSRVTSGKDTKEVEVKSSALSTEDVITAEGSTHVAHVEGTDASVENTGGDTRVDLGAVRATITPPAAASTLPAAAEESATAEGAADATAESKTEEAAPAAAPVIVVKETIIEETSTEAEIAVKETKVTEVTKEATVDAAA
ncbi:hypothetical protein BGW38_003515 [Lunasporangiospora selenospora]|uniref:PH domain-containing protein n=1 Tax=Lunasporangiospora selenospora TaxID=979761 RepID=A0A9P6FQK2_9FUNG|nr:hypothetical protein BGW38_003515 [Lunasporangiospora selenospora]